MRAWRLSVIVWLCCGFIWHNAQSGVLGEAVVSRNAQSKAPTSSARSQYVLHCAGCHGLDGSGAPQAQVPDMRSLAVFLKLDGGREFLLKIPGVMGSGLDDQSVANVSNWVFANLVENKPEKFQEFTAAEVAKARQSPLNDVALARTKLQQLAAAQALHIP